MTQLTTAPPPTTKSAKMQLTAGAPLPVAPPPSTAPIAPPTETTSASRPSRQKNVRQSKSRAHTKRRGAAAKGTEAVKDVYTTSETTAPTEPKAATNSSTEIKFPASELSPETNGALTAIRCTGRCRKEIKSEEKEEGSNKKTTLKTPVLVDSDDSSSLEEVPEEKSPGRYTEISKRRKQDSTPQTGATTTPTHATKPKLKQERVPAAKKPTESEKHRFMPEQLINLTKQFPLYSSNSSTSGPPLTRPESSPTDYDTIDLTEPRTRIKTRSAKAAPTRGKDTHGLRFNPSIVRSKLARTAEYFHYKYSASIGAAGEQIWCSSCSRRPRQCAGVTQSASPSCARPLLE